MPRRLRGPRDAIEIPGGSERLDFELEVGAIIGRTVESVTPEQASGLVAGYLILCDWSARDTQFAEMDGASDRSRARTSGPRWVPIFVTPDEIADRRSGTGFDLEMTAAVNGRRYGGDRWTSAYWSFEELISYASWNSRVDAGSLIGSGTCQGRLYPRALDPAQPGGVPVAGRRRRGEPSASRRWGRSAPG